MKKLAGQKGQSAVEFAMVLPVLIITSLGLIQLGLIYINAMMLKYTAYMTARVACVYEEGNARTDAAQKARFMLKAEQTAAVKYGDIASNAGEIALDMAREAAASYLQGDELKLEEVKFEKAKGGYIKVTVTYNMPLKVPFVNKIFGMFQNKDDRDVLNARTAAAYMGYPYYALRSSSIMRVQ